jgi:hypothetical protein
MKNVLIPAGILAVVFVFIVLAWGIVAQIANRIPPMQVVDFDFQGLHLGDPAPARLKIKNPTDDLVNEWIEDAKLSVWYTILDGKVEALTIDFGDRYKAKDAYEKKFGVKGTYKGDEIIWLTKDGEFILSESGSARICSEKYSKHATESVKKNIEDLSKKL